MDNARCTTSSIMVSNSSRNRSTPPVQYETGLHDTAATYLCIEGDQKKSPTDGTTLKKHMLSTKNSELNIVTA